MVGQNIGKYQILDRLGRGGMGTVYRAMDETLRREVAIKVLNAELNDPAVAKRFHAEAITVARLNHPGIATVYELFQHEGQWLMVMEFVRGETLEGLVTRKGPLSVDEAADIAMQALGALAHAHSLGVVHRDLKPANLMAADSGIVKIMDFGIARVAGTEHLTNAGFMMGTPAYMAPEQVMGEDIDARADIYAMGVVFFYLLTGQLPFKGKSPFEMAQSRLRDEPMALRTVRQDTPEWAEAVITRALRRDPSARFQSAPYFHDAIRRGLSGLSLDAAVPASPELMVTAPPGTIPVGDGKPSAAPESPELMETVLSSSVAGHTPQTMETVATRPALTGTGAMASADTTPPLVTPSPRAAVPEPSESAAPSSAPPPVPAIPPSDASSARASAPVNAASDVAPAAESTRSRVPVVAGAVLVIAIAAGVWAWSRHRAAPSATPPAETAAASQTSAPPPSGPPSATPDAANAPSAAAPGSADGAPSSPQTGAVADASAASREARDAPSVPAAPGPLSASASRADARGPAAATRGAGAAAPAAAAAGRRTTAAAPETFRDVRLLVVSGRKADERAVSLRFGDDVIAAVAERDGSTVLAIPEAELSYAAYTRGKDPTWSVILAGPPPNTDFPGGLFRSARHWLTLQSRSTFLILRLNDNDWRQVLEAVTARTGVQVTIAKPSDRP